MLRGSISGSLSELRQSALRKEGPTVGTHYGSPLKNLNTNLKRVRVSLSGCNLEDSRSKFRGLLRVVDLQLSVWDEQSLA